MGEVLSKLTPFWYEPEFQPEGQKISFLLRPLTQPQMVDVEQHYAEGKITPKAQWIAGTLGVTQVKGATHPETGRPARVPECFDWIGRDLLRACGFRLIFNDLGLEWSEVLGDYENSLEPKDDPEKN